MKIKIVMALLCLASSSMNSVYATDLDIPKLSFGFGMSYSSITNLEKEVISGDSWTPYLTFRASIQKELDIDWILSNGISLEYSQTHSNVSINTSSVIFDTKLFYTGLHDDFKPYLELASGKEYWQIKGGGKRGSEWRNMYRVNAGIEFTVDQKSSISVSFGNKGFF